MLVLELANIRERNILERLMERIAIKIEDGQIDPQLAVEQAWLEYELPGFPDETECTALASGDENQVRRILYNALVPDTIPYDH